jgi:hypothetical protein
MLMLPADLWGRRWAPSSGPHPAYPRPPSSWSVVRSIRSGASSIWWMQVGVAGPMMQVRVLLGRQGLAAR